MTDLHAFILNYPSTDTFTNLLIEEIRNDKNFPATAADEKINSYVRNNCLKADVGGGGSLRSEWEKIYEEYQAQKKSL